MIDITANTLKNKFVNFGKVIFIKTVLKITKCFGRDNVVRQFVPCINYTVRKEIIASGSIGS